MQEKEKQIIYYKDELNDEFSRAKIKPRKIDGRFKYNKSAFWEFWSFLIQNIISMPIKCLYLKIKFYHKFIGKEKFKKCKKKGIFIYANHTQAFSDTFTTSVAVYPKRNFLIVNPANISVKGVGWLVELLGAIPIPEGVVAYKNFLSRIKNRIKKGYSITIYPEAHIWPYYTKIRPFKDVSFKYPVELGVPVFCITNTYQIKNKKNRKKVKKYETQNCKNNEDEKQQYGNLELVQNNSTNSRDKFQRAKDKKIQMISYVDGPFFVDKSLPKKEAQKKLRDEIYEKMCERSKNNNVEKIIYKKLER